MVTPVLPAAVYMPLELLLPPEAETVPVFVIPTLLDVPCTYSPYDAVPGDVALIVAELVRVMLVDVFSVIIPVAVAVLTRVNAPLVIAVVVRVAFMTMPSMK